ncbi:heme oxygenase-like protein [Wolfiporia cocos MD-104 SS10]|uniref:Heme oxygenase-like protein n=1 Tax=Wolfiporia cocos (strain MD-104) TaxID=742152 RepID=A0A2H3IZD0_WOLCO|nr:heme oxygenase-like protein [Wolfiporia cocos MD-104 SS10]
MSTTETLTSHLLSLSTPRPYSAATTHSFLTAAGSGTLPPALLSLYLAQDRIFVAHAGIAFLGRLLAAVPSSSLDAPDSEAEQRSQRIVALLSRALQNAVREVGFFDEFARNWDLELKGWRERKATRDYTAELLRASIQAQGRIEDGLVFLWAMERLYLDAWTYVGSLTASSTGEESTAPAVAALVSNWTNPEFLRFVNDLTELVNSLGLEPGTSAWARAEATWMRVVELEEAFWPIGGEELSLLGA